MVRIITDSAADFEPQELAEKKIECINIKVSFGDTEYLENETLSKTQFYSLLETEEEAPKTAQPSPYAYECAFKNAMEAGDEAIIITLSSAISGTYQTVCLIKEDVGFENGYVFDSLNATGGQRILVEEAVRLRDAGKTAREIYDALSALREKIVLYACVDTLEYLHRGGRISGAAYAVGSLANIKPIIRVSEQGTIEVPGKMIGMRKGMHYLMGKLTEIPRDENAAFYVMYTHNRKNGEILAQELGKKGITVPDNHIINVGAAIGAHVGPNACGLVYVKAD